MGSTDLPVCSKYSIYQFVFKKIQYFLFTFFFATKKVAVRQTSFSFSFSDCSTIKPRGVTKIYPLPHMYVIKDLVVDFNKFLEQHSRIKPYLIRNSKEDSGTTQYLQSIKDREALVIHIKPRGNTNFYKLFFP